MKRVCAPLLCTLAATGVLTTETTAAAQPSAPTTAADPAASQAEPPAKPETSAELGESSAAAEHAPTGDVEQRAAAQEASKDPAIAPLESDEPTKQRRKSGSGAKVSPSKRAAKQLPTKREPAAPSAAPLPPEAPLRSILAFHLGVGTVWNLDPGYDLFSDDDIGSLLDVELEADVYSIGADTPLALQLGYSFGHTEDGTLLNSAFDEASMVTHQISAGVIPRQHLTDWFALHARLHAGVGFVHTRIDSTSFGGGIDQDDVTPHGGLGAGFSLSTLPRRLDRSREIFNSIAFGARIEGGYQLASAIDLAVADRAANPPDQRIAVRGADLGSVDRNGPYLLMSAFTRF